MTKERRIVFIGLLAIASVVSGLTSGAFLLRGSYLRGKAVDLLVGQISEQIDARLDLYFDPVRRNLGVLEKWLSEGMVPFDRVKEANRALMPMLQNFPQISSLLIADADGNGREYMLLHDEDQWLTRESAVEAWGMRQKWHRWKDATTVQEQWWEEKNYEPRHRPWYVTDFGKEGQESIFWTTPYRFRTTEEPGMTASTVATGAKRKRQYVVALDMKLIDISRYTSQLSVGNGGKAFLIDEEGRLLGLPKEVRYRDGARLAADVLARMETVGLRELAAAQAFVVTAKIDRGQPFRYFVDDKPWWGVYRPYPLNHRPLWIGVLIPEQELTLSVLNPETFFLLLTLIGLVVSLVGGRFLLRTLAQNDARRPIFAENGSHLDRLRAMLNAGEGDRLEFKSTVRWNLRANKAGKEMELVWLKTVVAFLNSSGGSLLLGVHDDGKVLGLAADQFASDDKCLLHIQNLLKEHVGLEFAEYIKYRLVSVDEQQVLLIDVLPAKSPAFLRQKQEEDFYVRVGPASRKLSSSEMLDYLKSRR